MSKGFFFGNRLTPEPEIIAPGLKGHRAGVVRMDDRVRPCVLKNWAREVKRDIFLAMQQPVVIPHYSLSEHQARVDKKPPAPSEPGWRQGELIVVEGTTPSVLVDSQGVIAAWVFPRFMKENTLDYHNDIVLQYAKHAFPATQRAKGIIQGAKSNGQARGGADKYTTTHGIFGTETFAIAWHQQLRQHDTSFAPSKDLVNARSIQQSVQRDYFFCSFRDIHWKINLAVLLVHPQLHTCLSSLRASLTSHPSCAKLLSIWDSIFPGHSLICNRTSGEHIDRNGIRRGFEAILAGGSFTGGSLYLKDLNARLRLLPGTLVLLDGTGLRHEVQAWNGTQRISHALFAHRSVLVELDIPHELPNVTLDSVDARLSRKPPRTPTEATQAPTPYGFKRPSDDAPLPDELHRATKRKCHAGFNRSKPPHTTRQRPWQSRRKGTGTKTVCNA